MPKCSSVHNGPDIEEIIRIPDVMFNSARLRRRNFYDELMNTLLRQPMQQVDSAITVGVSCCLKKMFLLCNKELHHRLSDSF